MPMIGRLGRRVARRVAAASILAGAVIVAGLGPVVVADDTNWTVARAPGTVAQDVLTPIAVVVTNSSGGGVGNEIGCLVLAVPSEFSVGDVSIVSIPIGKSWSSASGPGTAGSTEVRLWADSDDSRLLGITVDQLTFTIGVVGATPGPTTWIADVYQKTDCVLGRDVTKTFGVTIIGFAPTPPPSPTPTATPSPTPTATPSPTATPTPALTPSPSPTPTPKPTQIPTPRATPTPPATPGARSSPSPTPIATPLPGVSPDPSPASPGESPASRSPAPSALSSDVPSATLGASGTPVPAEATEEPPPGAAIEIGGPGSGRGASGEAAFGQTLSQVAMLFGRGYEWAVPGLLLSVPGMILVLAIAAQTAGALAWLPIVRRRIGGFGLHIGRRGRRS